MSELPKEFDCESFAGDYETWLGLVPYIQRVFTDVVTEFLPADQIQKERRVLEWDFCQSSTFATLLRLTQTRELVGFTYAKPVEYNFNNLQLFYREQERLGIDNPSYLQIQQQTADIGWTVILDQYRSKGEWTQMMKELERGIIDSGKFKFMIRTVREAGNYANKVKQNYAKRITYEDVVINDSPFGNQRYFRIKLNGSDSLPDSNLLK